MNNASMRTKRDPRLQNYARELRKKMTDAERRLWHALRGGQLNNTKFRRQCPIGTYIVDFVSFDNKLVIEPDDGQHATQQNYDAARSAFLQNKGFRVLRFWNHEVLQSTEAVLTEILKRCQTPS